MTNDTIIEAMKEWDYIEVDKALDKARADERSNTITELESRLLNIKYNDESVFEFVSVDSILKMLEQMKGGEE